MTDNKVASSAWNHFYECLYDHDEEIDKEFMDFVKDNYQNTSSKILDIGCGVGKEINYIQSLGLTSYGYEISSSAKDISKKLYGDTSDFLKVSSGYTLPWEDNFFNAAFSLSAFDHMSWENANEMVPELYRVLQPRSLAFIIVLDDNDHVKSSAFIESEDEEIADGMIINKSYFSKLKIERLFLPLFEIKSFKHNKKNACWQILARRI